MNLGSCQETESHLAATASRASLPCTLLQELAAVQLLCRRHFCWLGHQATSFPSILLKIRKWVGAFVQHSYKVLDLHVSRRVCLLSMKGSTFKGSQNLGSSAPANALSVCSLLLDVGGCQIRLGCTVLQSHWWWLSSGVRWGKVYQCATGITGLVYTALMDRK